jgi:hypothetical protein
MGMLDDFAGAFEGLDVTLRLRGPTSREAAAECENLPSETTDLLDVVSVEQSNKAKRRKGFGMVGVVAVTVCVKSADLFHWVEEQLAPWSSDEGVADAHAKNVFDIPLVLVLFNLGLRVQTVVLQLFFHRFFHSFHVLFHLLPWFHMSRFKTRKL